RCAGAGRVAAPRSAGTTAGRRAGAAGGSTVTGGRARLPSMVCWARAEPELRSSPDTARRRPERVARASADGQKMNTVKPRTAVWHVTANEAAPAPRAGSPTIRTPRPMCSRVTTTDGRSPGSRVGASRRLPRPKPSGMVSRGSPLTVAGAAAEWSRSPYRVPVLIRWGTVTKTTRRHRGPGQSESDRDQGLDAVRCICATRPGGTSAGPRRPGPAASGCA
ncbi:MAG: hypothetical protein JWR86_709, partial [Enterovirga sp.]|nr:hypothetical protein [Enterovirga sp.]